MVKLLAERAPAKINLYLRVTGKRPNGYHELDSIFLPVAWSDIVRIEIHPAREARVTLRCTRADLADVDRNLASRAAAAFMRETGVAAEVGIELIKNLPAGAGLGGGSSDAGAVLRMMARAFGVTDASRMAEIAVGLGADVPFFLDPRPARVRGIGEVIEPLAAMAPLDVVIAVPPVEVPTAAIFRALRPEHWSGAIDHADLDSIIAGRITPRATVNDLEAPAIGLYPEIANLKTVLEDEGALAAAMSGSGGAVFGVFADAQTCEKSGDRIRARAPGAQVIVTRTADLESLSAASLTD